MLCKKNKNICLQIIGDTLPEYQKYLNELKLDITSIYDEKDAVGRRYRRQDAIGTPFCITIDHQTLDDKTVTLRNRDSMKQERIKIEHIKNLINEEVSLRSILKKL